MTNKEKIVKKLAKIKAHHEKSLEIGNIEEAEVFAAKMYELLERHELDMTDIEWEKELSEEIGYEIITWESTHVGAKRRRSRWVEMLCAVIADGGSCEILVFKGSNSVGIVGHKSNREIVVYTCKVLVDVASRLCDKAYHAHYAKCRETGLSASGYIQSWFNGFALGLNKRYKDMKENRRDEGRGCVALVRSEGKKEKVLEYVDEKFKRTKTPKGGVAGNIYGEIEGRRAAETVELRKGLK